jgi:hypothetical protein
MLEQLDCEKWEYYIKISVYDRKSDFRWNLLVVSGDAQPEGRTAFLSEFTRLLHDNSDISCFFSGYFNIIRNASEKINL